VLCSFEGTLAIAGKGGEEDRSGEGYGEVEGGGVDVGYAGNGVRHC